jgi:hypothetical protein
VSARKEPVDSGPPRHPLKTSVDTSPPARMPRNGTHGVSETAPHGRSGESDRAAGQRLWPARGNRRALHAAPPPSGQVLAHHRPPCPGRLLAVAALRARGFLGSAPGPPGPQAPRPAWPSSPCRSCRAAQAPSTTKGAMTVHTPIEAVDRMAWMCLKRMPAANRDRLLLRSRTPGCGMPYGSMRGPWT